MEVLIPNSFKATRTPFSSMLLSDTQLKRAVSLFERVLKQSFEQDEQAMGKDFRRRVQTQAEMKRRAEIMAKWFRVFRGDLGFSLSQIENELQHALRCELEGGIYTPAPTGRSYGVPEGDTK